MGSQRIPLSWGAPPGDHFLENLMRVPDGVRWQALHQIRSSVKLSWGCLQDFSVQTCNALRIPWVPPIRSRARLKKHPDGQRRLHSWSCA